MNAFVPSECEALLKFKHHLVDPSNRLSSWNASNSNCCHWNGVVCSTDHVTPHVLQLHLNTPSMPYEYDEVYVEYNRSRFGGEINDSLVELKHLNHLDLSRNDFGGKQIPTFLWKMTSLAYLNLSQAGFGGNIPQQIGNLSNLLFLDLSFAAYGKIPSQIGNLTNLLQLHLASHDEYNTSTSLFAENLHWLSGLSHLQYLDLRYVNLSKSLDWLHNLQAIPSLTNLRLSSCTFPTHYNQPSSTSSLLNFSSHITTLDISNSNLILNSSSVVSKWIFGLRKLVSLQLSGNEIQGPIPDGIQNLTLIENLDLAWNHISSIPDWLYGVHHLKFLNLYDNNLCGNISDDIGNLTSLVKLDLSYNSQLEGRIPTSFGYLCNLREISLTSLKLNQHVDEILEILTPCISHGLTKLSIQSSNLLGNVTDQIGKFKNLVVLDFYNNSIHSALPKSFGELSSLRYLVISMNQLSGNPFEFLRSLSKLSYLSIDGNLFEGVVKEDDLANLTSLETFYASRNNITLEVSPNWHPSFQLLRLDMSSLKLGPKFPSWIQSQKNLDYLEMSNTSISDVIPPLFWQKMSHLIYLDLSNNHIHGELPHTIITRTNHSNFIDLRSNKLCGRLPHISEGVALLDLSSNLFSGTMTDFLCRDHQGMQMNLEVLNLASNDLSGEIPDCWKRWPNLAEVNLESNHFVGNLPPSMGSIDMLNSLHIGNNALSGTFPRCLKNTTQLISLDLGVNKFTGIIPAWVGENFSKLEILFLRSNKFLGDIPNEICALNNIQVLDLAQNNLSGIIPSCFNRFSVMTQKNKSIDSVIWIPHSRYYTIYISMFLLLKGREDEYKNNLGLVTSIDLSGNKLSGEIPKEITNLDALLFLNLSHNQLAGNIPSSIGNMGYLQSIDFSRNELFGEIPRSIANLSFLSMLDLSYNHLMGEIPMGTQIQGFNASDFVGNHLCGPPLPLNCSYHWEIPNEDRDDKESDEHEVKWFFVSMVLGFVVGFWGVVAPLFIFRSWRHTYYGFFDGVWYKIQSWWW